jgi:N-acyl-D-aspartate/D-glutamate deacylase
MYDVIIRGGNIVDGTGEAPYPGEVAVQDGVIVRIERDGTIDGDAREIIDATGCIVTPGFVDIHLTPSSWHGVTTAVFGNCGVGFAPVRPSQHEYLIQLMEGVEDIPGSALSAGIQWQWETFPEFLDAIEKTPLAVDVGAQVPHGPVRTYVMGDRGAKNEPATPEDIEQMAAIVKEGVEAGALGFSTSRTILHKAVDGEPVPGTFAAEDELFGIGRALGETGTGIFELAGAGAGGEDVIGPKKEMEWMRRLSAEIGRPISFAMLQVDAAPTLWRELLEISTEATKEGADIYPQIAGRPFGMLIGFQTEYHPFADRESYKEIAGLPLEERVAELRKPERRAAILAEQVVYDDPMAAFVNSSLGKLFPLGDPPNYEPRREDSVVHLAEAKGVTPEEMLYDLMLQQDGRELLLFPLLNYSDFTCDPIYEMLHHPRAALGLGDGGAHCGIICDASIPTFMLAHWVRDRTRGERIPVEFAVKRMTKDTADLYGLEDRGVLAVGMKGDVNVIDMTRVALKLPEMVHDLPENERRLIQRADGYVATIVSGEVIMREGVPTDARPGRLVRGAQAAPSA